MLRPSLLPGPRRRGRVQRGARPVGRRRCSRSAACSSRRSAAARRACCRTSSKPSPVCSPARERRAPIEPDRSVDVYDAVGFVRALADGLGVAGPPTRARGRARARSAGVGARVRRRRRCRSRRRARAGRGRGVGSERHRRRVRARPRRARSRARASTASSGRRRRSRRRPSTSRSWWATTCSAAQVMSTLQARGRRAARIGALLRRVPQRAAGGGAAQPRVRTAVPGARPHAHRRRGRSDLRQRAIDAVVAAHAADPRHLIPRASHRRWEGVPGRTSTGPRRLAKSLLRN